MQKLKKVKNIFYKKGSKDPSERDEFVEVLDQNPVFLTKEDLIGKNPLILKREKELSKIVIEKIKNKERLLKLEKEQNVR